MLRIAVDMDEVIADALTAQVHWLNQTFGSKLTAEAIDGRPLRALLPESHWTALQEKLHGGVFFGDLDPIPGSQAALQRLAGRHEIFVTTAAMEYPKSFSFKYDWVRAHFPFIDPLKVVFCGDKSILRADYLIDDNVRHFASFAGEGILYSAPHNRQVQGFRRVESWPEVERLFMT